MAANASESINKVAQPEASSKDVPTSAPIPASDSTDTKAPTSDTSAPPVAIDADTGKTAEAPLAPAAVTEPTAATKEVASIPVGEPANQEPPSIAKGDLSSKVDAADTLAEQPEKQADEIPTPVSQPSATDPTTAEAGAGAPDAESKLQPKPVSLEEVSDKGTPAANPLVTPATVAIQPPKPAEATASEATSEQESQKSEPEIGDKRKVDEGTNGSAEAKPAINGTAEDVEEPAEKKQKSNGTDTNGTAPKKPGRPKKEKKAPAPVGKTLRKTRSQAAAEMQ